VTAIAAFEVFEAALRASLATLVTSGDLLEVAAANPRSSLKGPSEQRREKHHVRQAGVAYAPNEGKAVKTE